MWIGFYLVINITFLLRDGPKTLTGIIPVSFSLIMLQEVGDSHSTICSLLGPSSSELSEEDSRSFVGHSSFDVLCHFWTRVPLNFSGHGLRSADHFQVYGLSWGHITLKSPSFKKVKNCIRNNSSKKTLNDTMLNLPQPEGKSFCCYFLLSYAAFVKASVREFGLRESSEGVFGHTRHEFVSRVWHSFRAPKRSSWFKSVCIETMCNVLASCMVKFKRNQKMLIKLIVLRLVPY